MTQPTHLFDHPRTKTHVSHAETLRQILAVLDSTHFVGVKLDMIETLARKGLHNDKA